MDRKRKFQEAVKIVCLCVPLLLSEEPVPQHDSALTGALYYEELMNTNSESRFRNTARMDKPTFLRLLNLIRDEGNLQPSKFICIGTLPATGVAILM